MLRDLNGVTSRQTHRRPKLKMHVLLPCGAPAVGPRDGRADRELVSITRQHPIAND